MMTKSYPSDLFDGEWKVIAAPRLNLLPRYRRRTDLRTVVDARVYCLRSGCAWRYLLHHDYPDWRTEYYHYARWSRILVLGELSQWVVKNACAVGVRPDGTSRHVTPSALVVDSQSVTSTVQGHRDDRGFDGNRRVNGVKRHVRTDTAERVIACMVAPANAYGGPILRELLIEAELDGYVTGDTVLTDDGYRGQGSDAQPEGFRLEIVKRSDYAETKRLIPKAFVAPPQRWIIEQTFGVLS